MSDSSTKLKFGTFGGVFTPCTLTILGVIMFLRFGNVVGQAGLINTLLIVLASKVITTLTTLSLSAIATNTKVRGGGAYFLISRSLGVEFGGAIGIVFYLAQAISVALYVIGFTEAFVGSFISLENNFVIIASLVNFICFVCVYIGAGWTIKVQYFILGVLLLAMFSFYVGAIDNFNMLNLQANLTSNFGEGESFSTMFTLFFPAVTGIMAGANMSGDLKDPAKSIPRGTLAAVLFTAIIYCSEAVLIAGSRSSDVLTVNNLIIRDIAVWPIFIIAGVFAATLSSALGSMMGAPRILQAFSKDEVLPVLNFFAGSSGRSKEPRRATILTFIIAQVAICLGDLNTIAPIITLFFMITYGLINVATFYEEVSKNPSYRPTFKYSHWTLSLAGALGCLFVMFLSNWLWAMASISVMFLLHRYISLKGVEARWGDVKEGLAFEKARSNLFKLHEYTNHPKNWRPNVIALTGIGWTRPHIPIFGQWLTAGHGILTLAQVVKGNVKEHAKRIPSYEKTIQKFIDNEGLYAFPTVVVASDVLDGVKYLLQCHGIGGLKANTILTGWPNEESKVKDFFSILRLGINLEKSVVALKLGENKVTGVGNENVKNIMPTNFDGTIDVWWRGRKNGSLLLLLAHLLHQNPEWRSCKIRVIRIVDKEAGVDEVKKHILRLAVEARIQVEPIVLLSENIVKTIKETSENSSIALFGFEMPETGKELEVYRKLEAISKELPRSLFVESVGGVALEI